MMDTIARWSLETIFWLCIERIYGVQRTIQLFNLILLNPSSRGGPRVPRTVTLGESYSRPCSPRPPRPPPRPLELFAIVRKHHTPSFMNFFIPQTRKSISIVLGARHFLLFCCPSEARPLRGLGSSGSGWATVAPSPGSRCSDRSGRNFPNRT